ncbi:3-oxoacyl-ACP synthase [Ralstonia solanacearum]|nr:3-oxoacyl-ACP synthase [Ralstonia solanacearum]
MEQLLAASLVDEDLGTTDLITQIVRAVRHHLRMPFAFVSEFVDTERVFRYVDSSAEPAPFRAGDAEPLADSYCARIADGRLPPVIRDAAELAAARELPVTAAFPIGAHLSVPIELADGRIYGTFCCFSDRPDHSLNSRDLELMSTFSRVIARHIEQQKEAMREADEKRERVKRMIELGQLSVLFQPIRSLVDMRLVGFEALSRFPDAARRAPYRWFAEAHEVELGVELEMLAVRKALCALPAIAEAYLAVNVSPATILSGKLPALLCSSEHRRLVLEITEHALVDDYQGLTQALLPLRRASIRIAIDDAGSGYSTMRHIIELKPDLIKLDAHLTINIEEDAIKRALVKAMATFASEIHCDLVAEGVETEDQKTLLMQLGVRKGQGYLLGRPSPLGELALGSTDPGGFA